MKGKDTMKAAVWIPTVLLLLVTTGIAQATEMSPAVLLQEALYQEETEGNLDKAIELYKQVVDQAADSEQIAAKATYQLGMCHLKKGQTEKAGGYFQEVVIYFSGEASMVQQAKAQLKKVKPAGAQDGIMEIISYMQQQHVQAYKKAKEKGIRVNSLAFMVDESGTKQDGGFITFENGSQTSVDAEITLGHFSNKDLPECYNEQLEPQQIRFEDTGRSIGRYAMKWIPGKELKSGEICTLLYKNPEEFLPKTGNGYRLEMNNHFGPEVLENFFVILPLNMKIAQGLDNLTSHKRVSEFDVYLWQKRNPENTTNSKFLDLEIDVDFADAAKPAVVETFPATYSNDVSPDVNEITVTFDQDMHRHGWAWVQMAGPENYPEVNGTPRYIDSRTCVLPVKIKPAKSYLVVVNSQKYKSFKSTDEVSARPYAIVFATVDEQGNPTEISADLLSKAEHINASNAIPEPVLDIVPASVRSYIAGQFYETHEKAQKKGLRTNSHVHIFDQDWNRNFGMVQVFKNTTGKVIDHEISMGRNDSPEMYIYDENGVRQKIRTYKVPNSNYKYFWTPSAPIDPNETRMLFYTGGTSQMKVEQNGQCSFRMQNHYGPPAIEDFYLVLPSGFELVEKSEEYTSFETIEGYDVYCWSKEQGFNVKHLVEVKLSKKE